MSYRGAVVDVDGTVLRGDSLLTGAAAGVDALRSAGLDLLFLSNNPTKTAGGYAGKLRSLGLDVDDDEVMTATTVATDYLERHHRDDRLFVVGETPLRDRLDDAGLERTADPAAADVVVGSIDREFDYGDLTASLQALEDGSATFVGTDRDRTIPTESGVVPGSGAIVGAMAAVSGRDPDEMLGKPSSETTTLALDRLGVAPEDCLLVGDRLDTDVAMGNRAGMTTALVLTGVTDRSDLADADVEPDHVVDSLGEIPGVLDGRAAPTADE